jgi:ABC-type transporter Mla maintaining outer membrane lipid asymmetry ATPase subunit MlaF
MIKAHGGEVVLNEREQNVLRGLIAGGMGGSGSGQMIQVTMVLDGRTIAKSQMVHLQQLIADGQLRVSAQ